VVVLRAFLLAVLAALEVEALGRETVEQLPQLRELQTQVVAVVVVVIQPLLAVQA
jgi:hypothetical protein